MLDERVPFRKPKNKFPKTKRAYNKAHSKRRIKVENVFAHVKNWTRISGRYDGTTQEFNANFNAICMTCARCTGTEPIRLGKIRYSAWGHHHDVRRYYISPAYTADHDSNARNCARLLGISTEQSALLKTRIAKILTVNLLHKT